MSNNYSDTQFLISSAAVLFCLQRLDILTLTFSQYYFLLWTMWTCFRWLYPKNGDIIYAVAKWIGLPVLMVKMRPINTGAENTTTHEIMLLGLPYVTIKLNKVTNPSANVSCFTQVISLFGFPISTDKVEIPLIIPYDNLVLATYTYMSGTSTVPLHTIPITVPVNCDQKLATFKFVTPIGKSLRVFSQIGAPVNFFSNKLAMCGA